MSIRVGEYDPGKDDFLHGRAAARLWGGDFRDVNTAACCEGCVFGSRYPHAEWCAEAAAYLPENVISRPEALL
jgi:hypothetical protein